MSRLRNITGYVHRLWNVDFISDSDDPTVETIRTAVESEDDATAVSSEVTANVMDVFSWPTPPASFEPGMHTIAIDVDVPATLVASSTSGHQHLYVDIPPVKWEAYERWLIASAEIGLIEPGYLRASQERQATFLRLPWVKKGDK